MHIRATANAERAYEDPSSARNARQTPWQSRRQSCPTFRQRLQRITCHVKRFPNRFSFGDQRWIERRGHDVTSFGRFLQNEDKFAIAYRISLCHQPISHSDCTLITAAASRRAGGTSSRRARRAPRAYGTDRFPSVSRRSCDCTRRRSCSAGRGRPRASCSGPSCT